MKKVIMFGIEKVMIDGDRITIYNRKVNQSDEGDNTYKASVKALKKGYAELMKGRAIA